MNGTIWANAFPGTALRLTIAGAASGDEVWVATGTYLTTTTSSRGISFSMKNGVSIYGSFAGTETLLLQRIFQCGPSSILSGEIGSPSDADNSYHVISNTNLDSTAVIDGFVIRGGYDNRAPTQTAGLGGGIYNFGGNSSGNCSPVIRNCLITLNHAVFGGGIFNSGHSGGNANPLIQNCIITRNTAFDGGGGIDNFGLGGNASPSIINCAVYDNTANTAGGMYCWGGNANGNSNPFILNCAFVNNQAIAGNAGGVIADNSNSGGVGNSGASNIIVRNSIFTDNTASGTGPQFFIKGTGTFTATYSNVNLTNQNPPHIISGPGTGNMNSDPMFVSVLNGRGADNCWFTADDGLTLQIGSPCINAGDNTGVTSLDLIGNTRIANAIVDMGPYESNHPPVKTLNLTSLIQGFYDSSMNTTVRDTLKIYIRNNTSPYAAVDSGKVYFNSNGGGVLNFYNVADNTGYFIQIRHRNSIETWSAAPEMFISGNLNYNFTDIQTRAFGSNQIQVDASPVKFAIYGGDINQDGVVDVTDASLVDNDSYNFVSGYVYTDLNGDNTVDLSDAAIADNNAFNFVSKITPLP
ncbi:MAG: hypothetical protein M3R36_12795 [Bacteroidota bacterium]|nr:hypothetical protein [Bacteroidota bacterium]